MHNCRAAMKMAALFFVYCRDSKRILTIVKKC